MYREARALREDKENNQENGRQHPQLDHQQPVLIAAVTSIRTVRVPRPCHFFPVTRVGALLITARAVIRMTTALAPTQRHINGRQGGSKRHAAEHAHGSAVVKKQNFTGMACRRSGRHAWDTQIPEHSSQP